LDKRLKSCERNTPKLSESTKRQSLQIIGIEEEEVQAKDMHNIFSKIIAENSPNLEKKMPIQVQETSRTPNRHDQNRTSPWHIIIKINSTENKERILKTLRRKIK
jgi:hypothetical protein